MSGLNLASASLQEIVRMSSHHKQALFGLFIGAMLGLVFGGLGALALHTDRHIVVRPLSTTDCRVREFRVVLESQTVSISGSQIDPSSITLVPVYPDERHPAHRDDAPIEYTVEVSFENCDPLVSQKRTVRRGWMVDEWIGRDRIRHTVRSR